MMKSKTLINKAVDIAKNYKTLYVMGCFGAPLTDANKKRYTQNHSYNKAAARTAMINAATADTFGFDCVNLIKGILWGWTGDKSKTYGGASYGSNGVPDIGADATIKKCSDVSSSGWDTITPGEAVWTDGHIGVYIGDGLAVECSPKWKNQVQITAVGNIGTKTGYNTRTWKKHGKLPWIDYSDQTGSVATNVTTNVTTNVATSTQKKAAEAAKSLDKALAGTYKVTASGGLHIRNGAGTNKASLAVLPSGTQVKNYGYYTAAGGVKWLYVQATLSGTTYTGFCSQSYLKKQ